MKKPSFNKVEKEVMIRSFDLAHTVLNGLIAKNPDSPAVHAYKNEQRVLAEVRRKIKRT